MDTTNPAKSVGELSQANVRLTMNVKALLEFTRRKQTDLATHLGLSQPYVSLLVNGKRPWTIGMLDPLADFFMVSVQTLFIDSDVDRRRIPDRRSGYDRRRSPAKNRNG
jgi:transcriptional regulator with XRE-family HTH domain